MINGFMFENDLVNYLGKLDQYNRDIFIIELIKYINYANYWYLHNKSRIVEMLYEIKEEKSTILAIEKQAKDAIKIGNPKFMNASLGINYSDTEVIGLYNKYLDIVYRNTFFFTEIYTISLMFDTMAFDCGFFP